MSTSRLTLDYDPALGRANTWRLMDDGTSIAARVRCGSAEEYHVEAALRREVAEGEHDERHHVRDLDGSTWKVSGAVFHPDLPRMELVLANSPDFVCDAMRRIP